ncbi:hypothetical protein PINS_up015146 [Pythium insidiosum]|nr:hypothetical protein PINS_up015146 [Pythium insidiosum]
MTASRRHRGAAGAASIGAAASAVTTVRLRVGGDERELLLVPTSTLAEVAACIVAGFEDAREPVAVRHATQRVVYSLAMVVRQPQRFTDAVYDVLFQDCADGGEQHVDTGDWARGDELHTAATPNAPAVEAVTTTTVKAATTVGTKRRHHHRRGRRHHNNRSPEFTVGMPEFVGMYDFLLPRGSSMIAETDGEDDRRRDAALLSMDGVEEDADEVDPSMIAHDDEDEIRDDEDVDQGFCDDEDLLRELDLTDFELPQLVHVFTQACPSGNMDHATFCACLEKILSQSGRYDPMARKMFTRLFEIFDADSEGVIDVTEFLGGVSVFASGERDQKIRFTFDLFDIDNDGYITLPEMTKYLTAVFIVIAETSPELFQKKNVDPLELGAVTARQCFQEAQLNDEGKLSFSAFQQWYSKPGPTQFVTHATSSARQRAEQGRRDLSFEKLKELSGLASLSPEDLFGIFSAAAEQSEGNNTTLTRDEFKRCFYTIIKNQRKKPTREIARFLDRLFNAFDVDGNDTVDFVELSSGLSVFCGGTRDDKIVAAFSLFDSDGDGFITREEMERYLTSVFHVVYETSPSTKDTLGIDAQQLAHYTTLQAFADVDVNHDGRLSLEEFRKWYLSTSPAFQNNLAPGAHVLASGNSSLSRASIEQNALTSIEAIASLTSLRNRKPSEVFEFLAAKVNDDGVLTRDGFHAVFDELLLEESTKSNRPTSQGEKVKLHSILDKVFDAFDTDGDDLVDFCELSSGISVFCDGTQQEKVRAAFTLFDVNQDGYISREEMETYLSSVFRMIFATSPATLWQMGNVSPEALAHITTNEAFVSADSDHDDRLSFAEFTHWYTKQDLSSECFAFDPSSIAESTKSIEGDARADKSRIIRRQRRF